MTFADCRLQTVICVTLRIKMTSSSIKQRKKIVSWAWGPGYEVTTASFPSCLQKNRTRRALNRTMASTDSRYDSFFFFLIGYRCIIVVSRLHDTVTRFRIGVKFSPRFKNRDELTPGWLALA